MERERTRETGADGLEVREFQGETYASQLDWVLPHVHAGGVTFIIHLMLTLRDSSLLFDNDHLRQRRVVVLVRRPLSFISQ